MKYYYISFEGVEYWIETDDTGWALRQIITEGTNIEISSFHDCLAEVEINEDEFEGDAGQIMNSEFETIWNDAIKNYSHFWEEAKEQNPIGTKATAKVVCFYPQGTVVQVGNVRGIYSHDKDVIVGQLVLGVVRGYDEENMWLLLTSDSN